MPVVAFVGVGMPTLWCSVGRCRLRLAVSVGTRMTWVQAEGPVPAGPQMPLVTGSSQTVLLVGCQTCQSQHVLLGLFTYF